MDKQQQEQHQKTIHFHFKILNQEQETLQALREEQPHDQMLVMTHFHHQELYSKLELLMEATLQEMR